MHCFDVPYPADDSFLSDELDALSFLEDSVYDVFAESTWGGDVPFSKAVTTSPRADVSARVTPVPSWTDGRRSKLSANERIERSRERNRAAQARFRQRQKVSGNHLSEWQAPLCSPSHGLHRGARRRSL